MNTLGYDRWTELADAQASGSELGDEDARFLREFAESDPLARAEAQLFESLGDFTDDVEPLEDEVGNRRLADAAVRAVLEEATPRRRVGSAHRARFVVAGLAISVAAAAAVLVANPFHAPRGAVEYAAAGVTVSGASAALGAPVAEGADVVAVGGPACVAVEPTIHACLADGASLRLSKIGAAERRVELLAGRVAIALAPLPAGERFSVVAGDVWSTAVGTAFTVERRGDGRVETIVHQGKVSVGAESGARIVEAHEIGLSNGGAASIESLGSHARTETPEWAALASVAGWSIEALPLPSTPVAEAAPAPAEPPAAPEIAHPVEPSTPPPVRVAPRERPTEVAEPETSASLLALARQALRDQRWSDAATAYRNLVTRYPASPEAHTVLVPLANLEIDRLGQPGAALGHLSDYLATGGALEVEARLAKIRALRSLGRTAEEAAAIDDFLSSHPSAIEAAKLRERRDELGPR